MGGVMGWLDEGFSLVGEQALQREGGVACAC